MTNLICAVTIALVTNVTEKFPQHQEPLLVPLGPNGESYAVYMFKMVDDPNPKSKTVITECKEVKTLSFEWLGQPREVKSERVLWSKSDQFALKNVWEPTTNAPTTNAPTQLPWSSFLR